MQSLFALSSDTIFVYINFTFVVGVNTVVLGVFAGFVANNIYAENFVRSDDANDDDEEEDSTKKLLEIIFALIFALCMLSFVLLCSYVLNLLCNSES